MAIRTKTSEEIEVLRECGARLAMILDNLKQAARIGVSTGDLDRLAEKLIDEAGGIPVFKGYRIDDSPPYPAVICTSINDEVVHAIPKSSRVLADGDILAIDIGMGWPKGPSQGFSRYAGKPLITDAALTVPIGHVSPEAAPLIRDTEAALRAGIDEARVGKRVGDISSRIEAFLRSCGLGIVRGLAGHGVGYELHEDPLIPNYGTKGTGLVLKEGMVCAIEPMATLGSGAVTVDRDGWTFRTKDGSYAAHFEHTIALFEDGTRILTVV